MAYWSGEAWRWNLDSGYASKTISVIEPAETHEPPKNAQRLPFGFARELAPEPVEVEPLLWDGD